MHQLAVVLRICQFHDKNKIIQTQIQIIQQIFSLSNVIAALCDLFHVPWPQALLWLCWTTRSIFRRECHFFGLINTLSSNYQHDSVVLGLLCIDGRDPHIGINCKRQIQAAEKQGPRVSISYYHLLPCSNGIKLCNGRQQQLMSNKREVFVGLDPNTKARFW